MNAKKTILIDKMPGLYAVATVTAGGEAYYAAASEAEQGPVALVHCDTNEVHYIHGGQGGVMGIMNSCKEDTLISIEEFYLGFNAPHSRIVEIGLEKKDGKWDAAYRKELAEVPYLHRLAVLNEPDGCFLAAGKLTTGKDFVDDWSRGGTLEMLAYDGNEVVSRETVHEGLFKHHAMLVEPRPEGDILYFGGTEGVFECRRENGSWKITQLLDVPTSEIVWTDLDGDGERELAIVEEFHGDKLSIFKDLGKGLERVLEYPLTLGHVLWGGRVAGSTGLISGSRDGGGELIIRRFGTDADGSMVMTEEFTVDSGGGPAQISVRDLGDRTEILISSYLISQLVKYTVSEQ